MHTRKSLALIVALIAWIGAACSAAGPKQIAVSPRLTPIAEYPGNHPIIYQATIELQVNDADNTAAQAKSLTEQFGGYLSGYQYWHTNGQKTVEVILTAPTTSFDDLRKNLKALGVLLNEKIVGSIEGRLNDRSPSYSSITLRLYENVSVSVRSATDAGWDPKRTFERAFGVFLNIFGFIADVLIWIAVVAGPFVLAFVVVWWLRKRLHSTRAG